MIKSREKRVWVSHGRDFDNKEEAISYECQRKLSDLISRKDDLPNSEDFYTACRRLMEKPNEAIAILQEFVRAKGDTDEK